MVGEVAPVHVLVDIQRFTECQRSPVQLLVDIITAVYRMWKVPRSCVGVYTAVCRYLCGRSPVHLSVCIQLFADIYVEDPLFMCELAQHLVNQQEQQSGARLSHKERQLGMLDAVGRVMEVSHGS